jgi:hypothetical protein
MVVCDRWSHFMALVGAPINPSGGDKTGRIVTIDPKWETNRPVVTYCDPTCRTLPSQPAGQVYVAKDLVTGSYYEATTFDNLASYRLWTDSTQFYEIRFNIGSRSSAPTTSR